MRLELAPVAGEAERADPAQVGEWAAELPESDGRAATSAERRSDTCAPLDERWEKAGGRLD